MDGTHDQTRSPSRRFVIAGRGVPFPEGYSEIEFGIFDPGNFILDSAL